MGSIIDPGRWFHERSERCSSHNLNNAFWEILFGKMGARARSLEGPFVVGSPLDFNMRKIRRYRRYIKKLNKAQNLFSFVLFASPAPLFEGISFRSVLGVAPTMPSVFRETFRELVLAFGLHSYDHVVFSVNSVFEAVASTILVREVAALSPGVTFSLANCAYENFNCDVDAFSLFLRENGLPMVPLADLDAAAFDPDAREDRGYSGFPTVASINLFDSRCYWNKCTFCTQSSKYRHPQGPTSLSFAVKKIEFYTGKGIRMFSFLDECFTKTVMLDLVEELKKNSVAVSWCCRFRYSPDYSPDFFKAMKDAGCVQILFGIETNSAFILERVHKYDRPFDEDGFIRMAGMLRDVGIEMQMSLIVGIPFERHEDITSLTGFIDRLIQSGIFFSFFVNSYSYYRNTAIHKDIEDLVSFEPVGSVDFNLPVPFRYGAHSIWSEMNVHEIKRMLINETNSKLYSKAANIRDDGLVCNLFSINCYALYVMRDKNRTYRNKWFDAHEPKNLLMHIDLV